MSLKVFVIGFTLVAQASGAALPSQVTGPHPHVQRYHPNMTTMWMTDERGRINQVFLTHPPSHTHTLLGSVVDSVFYFLYTREYNSAYELAKGDMERLRSSTFEPTRPTKVVIHGFWNTYQSEAVQLLREAYLNFQDVNILAVDWGTLASGPWYVKAFENVEPVGKLVGEMIDFLESAGATVESVHLIGHSLGAHVAAFASNHVTTGNITRISGLDPALPLFWFSPPDKRLDPSDANLVDCIHTCGGYLGFYDPLCTLDFYPNGGTASQPGCHLDVTGTCSHGRSFRYYSVSIEDNFTATSCASMDEVKQGRCSGTTGIMGDPAHTSAPGLYYLQTKSDYPYV